MSSIAQKILSQNPDSYFLITQQGEGDIDYYSIILQVPRTHESAFLRACEIKNFAARDFGKIIYYTAGEITLDQAKAHTLNLLPSN